MGNLVVRRGLALLLFAHAGAVFAQEADLAVTKTGPAMAAPGSNVVFQVGVANLGPDAASNVVLNDPLPAGMTFVSAVQDTGPAFVCSSPAVGDPGLITCTIGALAAGASASFEFTMAIPAAAPPGTFFTNIASASNDVFDPNGKNDSAVANTQTPPAASADLAIGKTAPTAAAPDSDISYLITLDNLGPDAAGAVSWSDTLPGDLTFVSLTQDSGPAFSCTLPPGGAGGTVNCSRTDLAIAASASFTLVAHVPAGTAGGTSYTNVATVSSGADPNSENDSSTGTTTISAVDLGINKSGAATVTAGQNQTYTITLTQTGPDPALSVALTDTLPAQTTFVSLSQNSGPSFVCSTPGVGAAGQVACQLGAMASGATAVFTLVVNVAALHPGGALSNTAQVTSESFDTAAGNNSSTTNATVLPLLTDLSVSKSAPATVLAGQTISYALGLSNASANPALGAALTDTLPVGTGFVSLSQTSGPLLACATPAVGGGGTVTCTIAQLAAGEAVALTLVVSVPATTANNTVIDNTASATSSNGDPVPGNNSASASTQVVNQADLAVTKTGAATAAAGENIVYSLAVSNSGPSSASAAVLNDALPAGTRFVSLQQNTGPAFTCTTPAVGATGSIACSLAQLPAGGSATFTLTVSLDAALANGSMVTNTANATSTTTDPAAANNSASATSQIVNQSDLAVTKTGAATAAAGQNLVYTLGVTNNGPSPAPSVALSDTLPAGARFVSLQQNTGPAFTCTTPAVGATGSVACSLASLPASGSATFTLTVSLDPSIAMGTMVTNTANVSSGNTDPVAGNNSATTSTQIVNQSDLALTKTGAAAAAAGQNHVYTIVLANNGPSPASAVALTDALPAGARFVSLAQNTGTAFACTTPAVGAGGTITCSLASLAPGSSAMFTLTVSLDAAIAMGTVVTNTANVTSTTTDPAAANNSASSSATISNIVDLAISKTGPATLVHGDLATYTITLANTGSSPALNVQFTDVFPAGTSFDSLVQATGPAFNCTNTALQASCSIASLAGGASASFQLRLDTDAVTPGTTLTNSVSATSTSLELGATNNAATAATALVGGTPLGIQTVPALDLLSLLALALLLMLATACFNRRD